MGVFLKNNRKNIPASSKTAINKNNIKNFIVKAVSLIKGQADTRERLTAPEYDLDEIKEASESDSYIKMAILKYSYMLFKAGYILKSDNEAAKKYIKTRLYVMGFCTGKPIEILFQEIGDDLIKYSNAFLVKSRTPKIMNGINAKGFFKDNPVGGYFRIDPATIIIQRDKNGDIKKYTQVVDGEEKNFEPTEVIHFYLDKEAKNAFGTPRIIAVLEDVKALRNIEGNIITLIHRFSMPLFHWIIGKCQPGFAATQREIEDAQDTIESMTLDGSVVTNEKTEIKSIGAEGTALNAQGYLTYFEKRVFSGLGVSETQMGRGTSTGDADSMESQAHDTIKHIQQVFSIFVQHFIFNELLLEGGFNPLINEEDRVQMCFNEISLDTKIKIENHEMAKYQSNMITFEEMRRELDRDETVDEERLYQNMIINKSEKEISEVKNKEAMQLAELQGDINIKVAKENSKLNTNNNINSNNKFNNTSGTKGNNVKGNGTEKSKEPNNTISNINTPQNQYGTTSVKVKERYESKNKINSLKKHNKIFDDIYNKYFTLSNEIKEDADNIDSLIEYGIKNILSSIRNHMQIYSLDGVRDASLDIQKIEKYKVLLPSNEIKLYPFEKEARDTLKKLLSDIKKKLIKNNYKDDLNIVDDVFSSLQYRLRFLLEYILPKVYCYSYLTTGAALGYKKAYVNFDKSEDAEKYSEEIDLENINLNNIPPFHSFCNCKVYFKKGEKK